MKKSWFLLFPLFLFSCEDDEPLVDPIPIITLQEIAPLSVQQFTDTIGILIKYEDGDGDVGFFNPDSLALAVQDLRLSTPDFYYVPPLTPSGEALAIQGTLRVVIRNTFLLGNGDEEKTRYEIKLRDRAGNWSNIVTTPEVTILR